MMKSFQSTIASILLFSFLIAVGCNKAMVIESVDYAQSIESVLTPNDEGIVDDVQQGISFNIKPLQYEETEDTSSVTVEQVRYIRGQEGFYYITASDFNNIYIMSPDEGQLVLEQKVMISEQGISSPALNQRGSYIQLVDRQSGDSWRLDSEGLQEEESQSENSDGD